VAYTEKEPAAKALLDACKDVKGRLTDFPVGEYMGFKLSLRYESFGQQINLLLRGAMTYKIELGTDALGNITRINNALDSLTKRLDGAKDQLANIQNQVEAAKTELKKPFAMEVELAEKEARLALLNADLNIDGDGGMEVLNDAENRDSGEQDSDTEQDFDDDEPEQEATSRPYTHTGTPPTFSYGEQRTGTYGKSKPSLLDDIRNYNSERRPPAPGGGKSAEIDI
jgi:hypothetical protein